MHIFSILCLFLCFASSLQHQGEFVSGGRRLMQQLGSVGWKMRGQIYNSLVEQFGDVFPADMTEAMMVDEDSDLFDCSSCTALLASINTVIDLGISEDALLALAVEVCYNITEGILDGDVVCPGIIANYGPHVIYVLNTTDESARETCQFFKKCSSIKERKPVKEAVYRYRENTVASPKPKPRADMFTIIQVTDIHLDPKYDPGAVTDCNLPICCRDYWEGTGSANEWGDYNCHLPVPTLEKMFESMVQFNPDIIFYTGDSANSALWEETQSGQINQTAIVASLLQRYLPNTLAHYAEGNHDIYPTNLHYGYRQDIQEIQIELAEMWAPLANFSSEQIETMKLGAYYTQVVHPGLRVISYNSNYGYTDNYYGPLLPESEYWLGMVDFLETSFNTARNNNEMVLLLSHHPPSRGYFDFYNEAIIDIINRNGDLIIIQLSGHTHSDKYNMYTDASFTTTSVCLSSSTGVPAGERNPSYKVFYLDLDTMVIQDAETYFLDLKELIDSGGEPEFELMYSYQNDYGMADLSPQAFQDFTNRMVNDSQLFKLYQYNECTRVDESERCMNRESCDDECRYSAICGIRSTSDEQYQQCDSMMPFP